VVAVWGGSIHGFMFGHVVAAPLFAFNGLPSMLPSQPH